MARETVAARLAAHSVPPNGKKIGHPTYLLRDAAPAILADATATPGEDGEIDPNRLMPRDRRDYWTSVNEELKAKKTAGQLCEAAAVEQETRALVAPMIATLDTINDRLERDAGLTPEQADMISRIIDEERLRLAEAVGE